MAKQTVTIKGYMGGPWTVVGDVEAGLILHSMGKYWAIRHIKTGLVIGPGCALQRDAKAKRARLFAILPDWSAPSFEELAVAAGLDIRAFTEAVRAAAY